MFGELHRFAITTYRQARRLVILLVGSTVLAIGVVMILLPGPAIVVIPLGLAILAIEFAWARRWLVRMREKAQSLGSR
jgi:tellurite resistance protein TerC